MIIMMQMMQMMMMHMMNTHGDTKQVPKSSWISSPSVNVSRHQPQQQHWQCSGFHHDDDEYDVHDDDDDDDEDTDDGDDVHDDDDDNRQLSSLTFAHVSLGPWVHLWPQAWAG